MKKKAIIISCVVLVVLLLGGFTVVLLGNGNKGNVVAGNDTEKVESTESTENIIGTEDIVVDAGSEMDTIEGGVAEEDTKVEEVVQGTTNSEPSKPQEDKPVSGSTESKPVENKPAEGKPQEDKPVSGNNESKPVENKPAEGKPQNGNTSSGSGDGNKDVVVNSNSGAGAKPEREETVEYSSKDLAAINAGYWNVTYDPASDMYVVLTPNGDPETLYKAYAVMDEYFNAMGYERVPTACRGHWVSSVANQYVVQCAEIRLKTNVNDTPPANEDEDFDDLTNFDGGW